MKTAKMEKTNKEKALEFIEMLKNIISKEDSIMMLQCSLKEVVDPSVPSPDNVIPIKKIKAKIEFEFAREMFLREKP